MGPWPEVCGLTYYHVMARGNRREDIFLDDNDRAGIEGGGAGSAGFQGLAWERREEGGVGEVPQGTDHGLLRVGGTGAVHGRAANAGRYARTRPWKSVRRKIPKAMLRFIERKANGLREIVTIMHTDPGFGFPGSGSDPWRIARSRANRRF